jgi:hypothetical protein
MPFALLILKETDPMRNRHCLMSLCGVLAVLWIAPSSVMSADLISADQIRNTLEERPSARQQQLFQQLSQLETLDAEQSAAIAEAAERDLSAQKKLTQSALQTLYFLRRADAAAVEAVLLEALGHDDPRAVILALDAVAVHQPEPAQPKVTELVRHPAFSRSYALRRTMVEAAAAYENADAVSFLVDLLPQVDGQLEYLIVRHLMRLTGERFGNHSSEWKEWWLGAADTYRGPPAAAEKNAPADPQQIAKGWDGPLPEFYDVPLFARKIVFLIDKSKSMQSLKDGETRMEKAQLELSEAVQAMSEDVQFNIIAYNEDLEIWQPTLVPASVAAKADAVRFAYALYPDLKTAAYDALSQGLQFDPNTELIVYLSDGKPTAGSIVDPTAIVQAITMQNMFQRTSIDTLGVDTQDISEQFMKDLANRNFGQYFKIR